jgi:two-component system alkaline phosphatase synthesis response regulator PhoP
MAEKSEKIAIVEDDLAIVQMYRLKFESDGYEVKTAGDGISGLKLIQDFQPDIVLLDLMMPQMGGLEVLDQLRHDDKTKDLKIVVLTNMGDAETASKVYKMKATDYIVKAELTPKEVSDKIKTLLKK